MSCVQLYRWSIAAVFFIFILTIPLKDSLFEISLGILTVAFVGHLIKEKDLSFFFIDRKILLSFGLIFLSMTLSNGWNFQHSDGWGEQVKFFVRFGLLYYSILYFFGKRYLSMPLILTAVFISFGIQEVDGLYQWITGVDFIKHHPMRGPRVTGAVFHPNAFGLIMMIAAIVTVYFLVYCKEYRLKRYVCILLVLNLSAIIACLLFSGSRAAWLGSMVAICFLLMNKGRKIVSAKNVLLLLLSVGLACFVVFTNEYLRARFAATLAGDTSHRIDIWKSAIEYIKSAPILGHGLGAELFYFQFRSQVITNPHNIFLEIMVDLGIVGLAAYAYHIYLVVRRSLVCIGMKNSLFFAIMAAVLITGLFDYSMTGNKIFLSLFYVTAALSYLKVSEKENR